MLPAEQHLNQNNNAFGTVLAFPSVKDPAQPPFGGASKSHPGNTAYQRGIWWFDDNHPSHQQPR